MQAPYLDQAAADAADAANVLLGAADAANLLLAAADGGILLSTAARVIRSSQQEGGASVQ
jgi:hypothetical protein